jgi:hypothetical protein
MATHEYSLSQPISSAFTNHVSFSSHHSPTISKHAIATENNSLDRELLLFHVGADVTSGFTEQVFKDFNSDRLTFSQFRRAVLMDSQLMSWFECLGTIF